MRNEMEFEESKEYKKDLKKLGKRFRSLPDDLKTLEKVLEVEPNQRPPFSFEIHDLGIEECVIKVKKIACRSLKGSGRNSGLRLVYAYFEEEGRIMLIELYFKGDKENEDRGRILRVLKQKNRS
ncbi:MAG: hypothetical protein CMP59_10210 [Flavobacteriales bacterium]|nr:hypothetical protein [Flavobacteriales bacterium]